ncbi:hypothetical protein [Mucilaginibacter sp.]
MGEVKYDLPADTAQRFALAPGAPPVFVKRGFGQVDVRTLTPAIAQKLINAGCNHIIAVDPPIVAAAPAPKAKTVDPPASTT